ncbi:hypothetical protein SDC9_159104 [bioreactor metagenome]|uniref:Uncharacterized protein n=1 Tax=bioreactor metagenome TaxID=1076179 RepID=A0A645FDX5_9ZZZZ
MISTAALQRAILRRSIDVAHGLEEFKRGFFTNIVLQVERLIHGVDSFRDNLDKVYKSRKSGADQPPRFGSCVRLLLFLGNAFELATGCLDIHELAVFGITLCV